MTKANEPSIPQVPNPACGSSRRRELAGILAAGVLRLYCRQAVLLPNPSQYSDQFPEIGPDRLDLSTQSSLTVSERVNAR